MKQNTITPLSIAFALCMCNLVAKEESVRDPFSSAPKTEEELQKEKIKCEVLMMRVFLQKDGKVLGNYTAYVSIPDSSTEEVFCEGVIKVSDSIYWRINVQADLEQLNHSRVSVDVDDLNLWKKNSDAETVPVQIFSSRQQSKGRGEYLCGEILGMTLRVVIQKAEQQE